MRPLLRIPVVLSFLIGCSTPALGVGDVEPPSENSAVRKLGDAGGGASVEPDGGDATVLPHALEDAATSPIVADAEVPADAGPDAEPPRDPGPPTDGSPSDAGAPTDAGSDATAPVAWPALPTCTDALIAASAADPGPACPSVPFGTEDPCFGRVPVRPGLDFGLIGTFADLDAAHVVIGYPDNALGVVRKADGREVCMIPADVHGLSRIWSVLQISEGRLLLEGLADGRKLVALAGVQRDLGFGGTGAIAVGPQDVKWAGAGGFFLTHPETMDDGIAIITTSTTISKFDGAGKPDTAWVPVRRDGPVLALAATGDGGALAASSWFYYPQERMQPFKRYDATGAITPISSASQIADLFDPAVQVPTEPYSLYTYSTTRIFSIPMGFLVQVVQTEPEVDWHVPPASRTTLYLVSLQTGFVPVQLGQGGASPYGRVIVTKTATTFISYVVETGQSNLISYDGSVRTAAMPDTRRALVGVGAHGALVVSSSDASYMMRLGL